MSIINAFLRKYASTADISKNSQYELYIRETQTGTLFRKTRILVGIVLKSELLFLEEIIGLIADHTAAKGGLARARLGILVSSPKGSIYLHESITNADVWRKRMRNQRVCVINADDGTVCIAPGHARNMALTERLKALLEDYKCMNGMIFEREVFTIFNLCADEVNSN